MLLAAIRVPPLAATGDRRERGTMVLLTAVISQVGYWVAATALVRVADTQEAGALNEQPWSRLCVQVVKATCAVMEASDQRTGFRRACLFDDKSQFRQRPAQEPVPREHSPVADRSEGIGLLAGHLHPLRSALALSLRDSRNLVWKAVLLPEGRRRGP